MEVSRTVLAVLARSCLVFMLAAASCAVAHAQTVPARALLIGVSGYPSLAASKRLRGPMNDVRLLRDALLAAGWPPAAITMLADQVPEADALPTRRHILHRLEALAKASGRGDWVLLYFSGHGAQQPQPLPAPPPPGFYVEPDGLDEIFLPLDVGRWNEANQRVEGAILDDEIAAFLRRLAEQGVHVWAVFDTCHAGGMAKGAPRASRNVSPEMLGIPAARTQAAREAASRRAAPASGHKRLLADASGAAQILFYAAQADEPTAEEAFQLLRARAPGPARPDLDERRHHGLFTYSLAAELAGWQGTFHDLARAVAARYSQRPFPTPQFEGDLALSGRAFQSRKSP